jgi:cell wall-associated NlpC family hydrolase
MVGQDTKMIFARKMDKYIGKPFVCGGTGDPGYDCFGMIYAWCQDNDITIEELDGWTRENYCHRMMEEKEEAERIMLEVFAKTGQPVDPGKILAGDILVLKGNSGGLFPAIFCGNGRAISSFLTAGTRVFSMKDIEIICARRVR